MTNLRKYKLLLEMNMLLLNNNKKIPGWCVQLYEHGRSGKVKNQNKKN